MTFETELVFKVNAGYAYALSVNPLDPCKPVIAGYIVVMMTISTFNMSWYMRVTLRHNFIGFMDANPLYRMAVWFFKFLLNVVVLYTLRDVTFLNRPFDVQSVAVAPEAKNILSFG